MPRFNFATRKKRRKREREAKKAKRAAAQRDRGRSTNVLEALSDNGGRKEARLSVSGPRRPLSPCGKNMTKTADKAGECGGRRVRRTVVSAEEREVSRLERLLKMKKRKKLPAAFRDDGLDYLLNLTDKSGDHCDWKDSADGSNSGMSSGEEPLETETRSHRAGGRREGGDKGGVVGSEKMQAGSKRRKVGIESNEASSTVTGKRVRFEHTEDVNESESDADGSGRTREDSERESEGKSSGGDDRYIDDSGDSVLEEGEENALRMVEGEGESEGEGEEGRGEARYLPPHMKDSGKSSQSRPGSERLQRALQGLVNRLNESNVQSICTQLEQMYAENSRNDMNSCLTEVLVKACVSPALLSERFAMLHAMVVAILHSNIGSEVGAYVIQVLVQKLSSLLSQSPNYGRGKECDCVLLLVAHLYNFKVVHCVLIYDIICKLVENFTERNVELLLLLLKNTGMEIRKDDATSLKDIILQIQSKAAASNLSDSSRTRFMLETINALKTNNSRKIPNHDPSLLVHMRRLLRGLVRSKGPADENQLKISLQDLLLADQQGRWWVVGSSWTGRETSTTASSTPGGVSQTAESWVLELARKQRMNTDIRKNIFSVLMTSEDCLDAFEKLLRLGLKNKQEREIVHVLIDCCLQEKQFNPYYAFLGQKFCEFNRTHQVTFQYSLWDRLKTLCDVSSFSRSNLHQLLAHLVTSQALSLSVLRVVEFTELGKQEVKFYKKLLHAILVNYTEDTCKAVFSRLSAQPHLKSFRDSLLVFMKHYLEPQPPSLPSSLSTPSLINPPPSSLTKENLLRTRLQLAEQIMRTPHTTV